MSLRLSTWLAIVGAAALVLHEVLYHLTAPDPDFPLRVLAGDQAVFVVSHGGLDSYGAAVLLVFTGVVCEHFIRKWIAALPRYTIVRNDRNGEPRDYEVVVLADVLAVLSGRRSGR